MVKKKQAKRPEDLTDDEVIRRIFPKEVVRTIKKPARRDREKQVTRKKERV